MPVVFSGERSFVPVSGGIGALYDLGNNVVLQLNGQAVERAPAAAELFSKGIHEATGTFEIGNPFLDTNWFARTGVLHAFEQDRVAPGELTTPGYTLLNAELSYVKQVRRAEGLVPVMTIGIKGENLLDDEVLNSASFQRREGVLQPGANVRVFGSIKLN
jgi:outer membrane receptor protein involved in Fe transport